MEIGSKEAPLARDDAMRASRDPRVHMIWTTIGAEPQLNSPWQRFDSMKTATAVPWVNTELAVQLHAELDALPYRQMDDDAMHW